MPAADDGKKVTCPNCGNEIDVSFVITQTVICPECRTNVSLSGEAVGSMTLHSVFDRPITPTASVVTPSPVTTPSSTVVPTPPAPPSATVVPPSSTVMTSQAPTSNLAATVTGTPDFTQAPPPAKASVNPADLKEGDEVENFIIEGVLGRGAMGVVYLARDTILDRLVALKFMAKELVENKQCHDRFIREGRMLANLKAHTNLVTIYSGHKLGKTPYFAMEYVEGHSVKELMGDKGPLSIQQALDICRQAAEALDFVWKEAQLVHRDIKPSNLMFSIDGKTVKVTDFGLAKPHECADDTGLTQTGIILGTPDYLAPELARCEKHLDCRTDMYALGATLFHLIAGRAPFIGRSVAEVVSAHLREEAPLLNNVVNDAPDLLVDLVARMLDKEPGNRPETYQDIIEVFKSLG